MKSRRGFTLIELMIVMGITVILGVASYLTLQGGKTNNDLTDTTNQITTLLRQAQSDAMGQEQDAAWGVYFSNAASPFYALYINAYATSTVQAIYRLPSTVGYGASFLASGATTSIMFSAISGAASAAATVQLYATAQPSLSSTIVVATSGTVSD